MSDIEKIDNDGPSDAEKTAERFDGDFEGHKLESKMEPKIESDFEGHKLESFKIEEKLEERAAE